MNADAEPARARVMIQQATTLCDLRRFREAIELVQSALAMEPDNSTGWCVLARALLGSGRFVDAELAAERASKVNPENEWAYRLMSAAAGQGHDYLRSVARARRATEIAPHEYRTHIQLSHALRAAKQFPEAAIAADEARTLAPNVAEVHLAVGYCADARGDGRAASGAYRAALALDPENTQAHHSLARLRARRFQFAPALTGFATALRIDPRSAHSRAALNRAIGSLMGLVALLVLCAGIAGIVVDAVGGSSSGPAHVIPMVVVAIPVSYTVVFVLCLPTHLRRYVLRLAATTGLAVLTGLEILGICAITVAGVAPHSIGAPCSYVGVAAGYLASRALVPYIRP